MRVLADQGESDTGNESPTDNDLASKNYACMMPALIADWRAHWSAASGTAVDFPFGIVQISAYGGATSGTVATGTNLQVPALRWGQSANYGYAPNPKLPRTFMALALDMGAYQGGCCAGRSNCNTYPGLCIHPWWKQEVGRRLALGMMNIGYNDSTACHQGPFPASAHATTASAVAAGAGGIKVTFKQQDDGGCGSSGIMLRRQTDFELKPAGDGNWTLATIVASDSTSVTLQSSTSSSSAGTTFEAVRYLWSTCSGEY
jgi:sialate O-acetylesterase